MTTGTGNYSCVLRTIETILYQRMVYFEV